MGYSRQESGACIRMQGRAKESKSQPASFRGCRGTRKELPGIAAPLIPSSCIKSAALNDGMAMNDAIGNN
ncbi:hypothetical protein [Microcoleus sp. K5-D4]|uniref:hypothetical protein n=1 Tax=Microcoleus sp. K5-D4 TaxID=2818801 RepID=UPI002FCEECC8